MLWEEFLEEEHQQEQQNGAGDADAGFDDRAEDGDAAVPSPAAEASTHRRLAYVLDLFAPHNVPYDSYSHAGWRTLYFTHGMKDARLDWASVRDVLTATNPRLWQRIANEHVLEEAVKRRLVEKHPSSNQVRITRLGAAYHAPFFDPACSFMKTLIEFNRDKVKSMLVRAAEAEATAMFADSFDTFMQQDEVADDACAGAQDAGEASGDGANTGTDGDEGGAVSAGDQGDDETDAAADKAAEHHAEGHRRAAMRKYMSGHGFFGRADDLSSSKSNKKPKHGGGGGDGGGGSAPAAASSGSNALFGDDFVF